MDKLEQIFKHQEILTRQFFAIERHNNLIDYDNRIPFDLDDPKAQKQLRSTAWYMLEEIVEVLDTPPNQLAQIHEEIADVAHFLVELLLCSGINATDLVVNRDLSEDKLERIFLIVVRPSSRFDATLFLIQSLGRAMHRLKAKPWKVNPRISQIVNYRAELLLTFFKFISFAISYGLTSDTLFDYYMNKAAVNQKRIDRKD